VWKPISPSLYDVSRARTGSVVPLSTSVVIDARCSFGCFASLGLRPSATALTRFGRLTSGCVNDATADWMSDDLRADLRVEVAAVGEVRDLDAEQPAAAEVVGEACVREDLVETQAPRPTRRAPSRRCASARRSRPGCS